ncbi:MAG: iron-containing alcohol dehydrogenase [Desulfobacter sp.]|nr:MAG: iron-containing alcohol dehydrogenase [Desulfobacter sp.]
MVQEDALLNLRTFLSPEIVYGRGALDLCGRHALSLGASKVCVVTDPGVRKAGWTKKAEKSLSQAGIPHIVFDAITPNPKAREVMEGSDLCIKEECDLLIAVGGGSPMDCAKGMGVIMGNAGHILDYQGVDMVPSPGPPLIFIPTTAGSAADVSQFAIVTDTDRKVKVAIISKMVIPDIALIDPETTTTMPPDLTAATGMDTLCHAFEAYASTAASPLTDMAALSAVRLTAAYLVNAYREPGNMKYRDKMMTASLMAGLAFSNASLGLVHAMAHSLGGALGLPHGECNALLLEQGVKYNYGAMPEKYNDLAEAMQLDIHRLGPDQRAAALSQCIAGLRKKLGITQRLSSLGVRQEDIPGLSEFAFKDPCLATNPREAGPEEIQQLYMNIF